MAGLKELAFLRDLAEQNSLKYGVSEHSVLPVVKGSMMVLNQLSNLETTLGRFYTNLPNRMVDQVRFSLPYTDPLGDGEWEEEEEEEEGFCFREFGGLYKNSMFPPSPGFIMTVSRPCYFGNLLLGVVGVDVNLACILEDVTYYQDSVVSYSLLIDNKGTTCCLALSEREGGRGREGGSRCSIKSQNTLGAKGGILCENYVPAPTSRLLHTHTYTHAHTHTNVSRLCLFLCLSGTLSSPGLVRASYHSPLHVTEPSTRGASPPSLPPQGQQAILGSTEERRGPPRVLTDDACRL